MTADICYHKEDTIGFLTIDLQSEKVNKLSGSVMRQLSHTFDEVAADGSIKVLIIRSKKLGMFVAGADITELQTISSEIEAQKVVELGQSIFNKCAHLSVTTVAAINGVCLGGGCELALACDFRVASDSSKTTIGLPEVNLGIIPGWGGTQRLPRLIGLQRSLPLILVGKGVGAKKAFELGIVDAVFPDAFFDVKTLEFISNLSKNRKKIMAKRRPKGLVSAFLEHTFVGQFLVFRLAKKEVLLKTQGNYPAPLAALNAIRKGFKGPLNKGLQIEARYFAPLVTTDVSKNLVSLFFTQESLKKYTGVSDGALAKPIHEAAVLGAGLMGGGIAWLFSNKDLPVRIKDIAWSAIAKGYESASKIYAQLVKKRRLTPAQASMKLLKISSEVTYVGFHKADIVVEAVVENIDLKKTVFQELESVVSSDTIIATNTSSLSITDMASVLAKPERFIGMHFFSPVNRMPLVEVIPGEQTGSETIATVVALSKQLKKTPIVVQNCPGFLVNRILIPYVNEAVLCLEDGAKIPDIDQQLICFGMPLGPLALADEVGLDVGYKVAKILEAGYGDRMKVARSFHRVYENETLRGKKTGVGFYKHQKEKVVNDKMYQYLSMSSDKTVSLTGREIEDRCIFMMINEAARCLDEKIVETPGYLDMAMIMGTGFPPFRGGLCKYADQLGIDKLVNRLQELTMLYGSRFEPADLLVKMKNENKLFYI